MKALIYPATLARFLKALFFALLGGYTALAQTIRIADNNSNRPNGTNIFSTVQAAVDASAPGDIVYVVPSLAQYGDVTIGKRITLLGVGFGITELGGKFTSIRQIFLQKSSDGITGVSGSVFKGFSVDYFVFTNGGTGSFTFDDIVLDNIVCYQISEVAGNPAINNFTLSNSIIGGVYLNQSVKSNINIISNQMGVDIYQQPLLVYNASNILITNNIILRHTTAIDIRSCTNVRFEHNIVSGAGQAFESLQNTLVVNNIFLGMTPGCANTANVFRDNVFSNNVVTTNGFSMPPAANGGGINTGTGNLASGTNPQFVNASVVTVESANNTFDYTLAVGSPCINAATTNDNIGPSGGMYPWTTNLVMKPSSMPVVTLFGNSGVVPQNQPLKSNIKVKAN